LVFYSSRNNLISLIHKLPILGLPLINKMLHLVGLHLTTINPYIRRRKKQTQPVVNTEKAPEFYAYAHNPMELARPFKFTDVTCLASLTNYDTQLLRKFRLMGIVSLALDLLERAFPHAMRYIGKFTCIRIRKT